MSFELRTRQKLQAALGSSTYLVTLRTTATCPYSLNTTSSTTIGLFPCLLNTDVYNKQPRLKQGSNKISCLIIQLGHSAGNRHESGRGRNEVTKSRWADILVRWDNSIENIVIMTSPPRRGRHLSHELLEVFANSLNEQQQQDVIVASV